MDAVDAGRVPLSEIDDHARRVLYAEFLSGIVDDPPQKGVPDVEKGLEAAQHVEENSIVLLKNRNSILPIIPSRVHSIAIIGGHADVGMISGGGSAQVDPPGGNAIMPPGKGATKWQDHVWFPTSPLQALRAKLPNTKINFDPGTDPASAAKLARNSDLVIVFAYQWESEGMDLPNLSLPDNQDALIAQVAAANPHTIVVLETGTAVTMPWLDKVSGVVEVWFAGSAGHKALANILRRRRQSIRQAGHHFPEERTGPSASSDSTVAAAHSWAGIRSCQRRFARCELLCSLQRRRRSRLQVV